MRLVEREREFLALRDLFTDCRQAKSRVVVISGGVATGKTTLLRAFGEHTANSGAVFLSAVASPTERNIPLGVLEQLLRSPELPEATTERAARWLDASAVTAPVCAPAPGGGTGQISPPAVRGLWDVLRDLTDRGPVVIGIDDVHYADETSLRCLLYLLRRLRSARLLTVLTECPRSRAANSPLQSEFLREPHSRRIRLEPLSDVGVAAMLAKDLDGRTAQHLAPDVHRASAGHPTLVHALIEDYLAAPKAAVPRLSAGESFGRAVLNFLYRHEFPVMEVARAIAILREPVSLTLLSRLLDIDVESAAQGLSTLTAVGMLENGRFRHGADRAAVVDGIPPDLRRSMHDRAAGLLHTEGVAATEVASHIVTSNRSAAPWVIATLQEAADNALANDDLDTGIRYLRTAYQMCGDKRQRSTIASALADAEWRVDPSTVLRYLPEFDTAVHEDLLDARNAHTPVTSLLWHGRVGEALGILHTLRQRRNGAGESGIKPALNRGFPELWLAYLYPELYKDVSITEVPAAGDASGLMANSPEHDEATMLAAALLNGNDGDVLTVAEEILDRSRLSHTTLAPLSISLAALIYNDVLDRAAAACDSLIEESVARRSPTWHALFTAMRAMIFLRQGNLVAAEERADAALQLISPKSWGVAVGLPIACMVLARTAMGRIEHAADLLDISVPEAMFRTPMGLHFLYARGYHHLAANRCQAALYDFRACGKLMSSWGIDLPAVEPWRIGAAQAHLCLGEPLEARQLVNEQLALSDPRHLRTRGISLRVLAATHDLETRSALLNEAASLLHGCGDQLELSYTLTDLSDTYRRLGEDERAGLLLHDAHVLARQCKAGVLDAVQACGAGDGEFDDPAHNPAHSSLSDAEQRVAALAAEGNTNREISRKLYITVSTVEQHLTKIYRKLNVKRFDLKLALQDLDRDATARNGALALGQVTLHGPDAIRGHESRGGDGESLAGGQDHGCRSRPSTDLSA